MNETIEIGNPENYKIYIQLKKNRRLRRNATYLTTDYDFVEDINMAQSFENLQEAEEKLRRISNRFSPSSRPRIIIKYTFPTPKQNKEGAHRNEK